MRTNPEALEYIARGRGNKILLDVEEALGGHSKVRHSTHLSLGEMQQRVLGTHPSLPQSRSALKFDSDAIHEDAINKVFREHKTGIKNHFNSREITNYEIEYSFGRQIGTGYTNMGSFNNPVSSMVVTSSKAKVIFKLDSSHPDGYRLLTAYPLFP